MKRALAIAAVFAFAIQALGLGGVCQCVTPDSDVPMAADHSCCRGSHDAATTDATDGSDADIAADIDSPHSSCQCGTELATLSELAQLPDVQLSALFMAGVNTRPVARAARRSTDTIRGPPHIWPPPRLPDRIAKLQTWLC